MWKWISPRRLKAMKGIPELDQSWSLALGDPRTLQGVRLAWVDLSDDQSSAGLCLGPVGCPEPPPQATPLHSPARLLAWSASPSIPGPPFVSELDAFPPPRAR